MAGSVIGSCDDCGRTRDLTQGLCFGCRVRTVGFTFRGAHVGRQNFHEGTVMGEKAELYREAREAGTDMERAR